jgi:hypothetical protein
MIKWQLAVMAVPAIATSYLKEPFEPKANRWYDSKIAERFDFNAGNDYTSFIADYGLYAKYGDDSEYAISTKLTTVVAQDHPTSTMRLSFSQKQEKIQECGET